MSIEVVIKEKRPRYEFNVGYLTKYGNKYKVSHNAVVIRKGTSIEKKARGSNPNKLDCNMRRSKKMIKDYGLCNDWQFFVTFTLDQMKQDRYNLSLYIKKLSHSIRNLNRSRNEKIEYLLIPEQHKDGAWHMHGFIRGLKENEYVFAKKRKGRDVFHWIMYKEKFGFCDMEFIEDRDKAVSYLMKYITKDLSRSVSEINAKSYYCSKGLNKPEIIKKGIVSSKYNPCYEKKIEERVVYSEMWLRDDIPEEIASSYIDDTPNGYTKSIFEFEKYDVNKFTGEMISEIPESWKSN